MAADLSTSNIGGSFVKSYTYDWVASGVDDDGSLRSALWSKTDGSSICPVGYRVPTIAEIKAETIDASTPVNNNTDLFNSFLKIPAAGYRTYIDGSLKYPGEAGLLWSSTPGIFLNHNASKANEQRGANNSAQVVRCIRD